MKKCVYAYQIFPQTSQKKNVWEKKSDKVDEHDDTFNKDEVKKRPLWSTCMTDRKTVSGALCDAAKIVLWQILNDKIMKLEMKMKVERLKLRLTGPVNYVLYIFKMFDRKWMNSNIRVIYLKFSFCILDATC